MLTSKDMAALIEKMGRDLGKVGKVAHYRVLPPAPMERTPAADALPTDLAEVLQRAGITGLYRHQAETYAAAAAGEDVVLSAPTASGKSLAYQLPLVGALLNDPQATGLYISPAKALAQQQLARLRALVPDVPMAMYDGDTPKGDRRRIRETSRVIATNPDMLNLVLPYHKGWEKFLRHLRVVVIDESHEYGGAFGSHMAQVMRRLRRLAAVYGAEPRFILLSATIGNPREHAAALIGREARLVQAPPGGKADRHFVLWRPETPDGTPVSHRDVATAVFSYLVSLGLPTLLFAQSRKGAEEMYLRAREALQRSGTGKQIAVYRGGYQAEERRETERAMFAGEFGGVVATTALELGIDLGDLAAVVMDGYPGSQASLWQQAGRAGRGTEPALDVLVLGDDALDRYFELHPDAFFDRAVEQATVSLRNQRILLGQMRAAAWEAPLSDDDVFRYWGQAGRQVAAAGLAAGDFATTGHTLTVSSPTTPALAISLRGADERYRLVADGHPLEETDAWHAQLEAFPGAFYISRGRRYVVTDFDLEARTVTMRSRDSDVWMRTVPQVDRQVQMVGEPRQRRSGSLFGEVMVSMNVKGYRLVDPQGRVLSEHDLNLPPYELHTEGLMVTIARATQRWLMDQGRSAYGSLHAVEHLLTGVLPVVLSVDRRDMDGVTDAPAGEDAHIVLYDTIPGGVGYAEGAFTELQRLLEAAHEVVSTCPCTDGCPSCIQSARCLSGNEGLDKGGAKLLLGAMIAYFSRRPPGLPRRKEGRP